MQHGNARGQVEKSQTELLWMRLGPSVAGWKAASALSIFPGEQSTSHQFGRFASPESLRSTDRREYSRTVEAPRRDRYPARRHKKSPSSKALSSDRIRAPRGSAS